MPKYDYRCKKCDTEFEKQLKMNDPNPPCPECASEVKKIIKSISPVYYHADGFYITDSEKVEGSVFNAGDRQGDM